MKFTCYRTVSPTSSGFVNRKTENTYPVAPVILDLLKLNTIRTINMLVLKLSLSYFRVLEIRFQLCVTEASIFCLSFLVRGNSSNQKITLPVAEYTINGVHHKWNKWPRNASPNGCWIRVTRNWTFLRLSVVILIRRQNTQRIPDPMFRNDRQASCSFAQSTYFARKWATVISKAFKTYSSRS